MTLRKIIFCIIAIPGTILDQAFHILAVICRLIIALDAMMHHTWHLYRVWANEVVFGDEMLDPRYFTLVEIFSLTYQGKTIDYDVRRAKYWS